MRERHINDNWLGTCRGIAVFGVLLTHFLPQIDKAYNLNSGVIRTITVDVIDTGKIGVALLFLIAGFLTASSKRKRNVKQFAVNRLFRLYPVYWLDIILVGILFSFDGYGLSTVLANCTMLQVFMRKEDLVGLFWTLPIELLLYIGGVLFERYMWEYKRLLPIEIVCAIGTVGIAAIRRHLWLQAPVAIGLLLTIGLLGQFFRLYMEKIIDGKKLLAAICVFFICLLTSSYLAYQVDVGHQENWYRYVLSYSSAILIFAVFMKMGRSIKAFSSLAIVAYPVYLLQEVVFRVAFENQLYLHRNGIAFTAVLLLILIGISVVVHIAIEKPCVKIGNCIEKKLATERK